MRRREPHAFWALCGISQIFSFISVFRKSSVKAFKTTNHLKSAEWKDHEELVRQDFTTHGPQSFTCNLACFRVAAIAGAHCKWEVSASTEEQISVHPRYPSHTSRLLFHSALPVTLTSRSSVSLFLLCSSPLSLKLIINLKQPRDWKPKPKLHFPAAAISGRLLLTLQGLLPQSGQDFVCRQHPRSPAESSNAPTMRQPPGEAHV